jgi:hypothetical protein
VTSRYHPGMNYDAPLYWYRKVDRHPDPRMNALAEVFCKQVSVWLGLEGPPRIYWFEEAEFRQARGVWSNYPAPRKPPSADPLQDHCEYFRWSGPPKCVFVGYTHHDSPLGIMINVCRRDEDLLKSVAHECFHIYQDAAHGVDWRNRACRSDVEGEAGLFVGSKTDEIRTFIERWKRTPSCPKQPFCAEPRPRSAN